MSKINLDYKHCYPLIEFQDGSKEFGEVWGLYDNLEQKMKYYFTQSSDLRRLTKRDRTLHTDCMMKMSRLINRKDIVSIEYFED